jgi:hypothetical protein
MVHWSALARWEETKAARRRRERYAPPNLLAALQSVQESATPVVGVDGAPTSLQGLGGELATDAQAAPAEAPPPVPLNGGARPGQEPRAGAPH